MQPSKKSAVPERSAVPADMGAERRTAGRSARVSVGRSGYEARRQWAVCRRCGKAWPYAPTGPATEPVCKRCGEEHSYAVDIRTGDGWELDPPDGWE